MEVIHSCDKCKQILNVQTWETDVCLKCAMEAALLARWYLENATRRFLSFRWFFYSRKDMQSFVREYHSCVRSCENLLKCASN